MPGGLPRRYRTIDIATGGDRPASPAESALLAPAGEPGTPGTGAIVYNDGSRVWLARETDALTSPDRIRFAARNGHEVRCAVSACTGAILAFAWDTGGKSLVFLRREGWANSRMAFYRWKPKKGAVERLSSTGDVLLGCVPRRVAATMLCTREASMQPRRLVEIDPNTGKSAIVYDPNPEFAHLELGTVRRLHIRNERGALSWADLVLPPGHKPGRKLPMIVVQYHSDGFLRAGTGDEYPIFPFAARGFAVLSIERPSSADLAPDAKTDIELNRALTAGWIDRRNMLSSVLKSVELAIATGLIDPDRIGITGLSDGASSARFALVNSRKFAAAAISQSSFEPNTVMTHGGIALADYNRKLGYPGATARDDVFWRPYSIALNARDIDVPLLIQAADDEYLLALETFTALRENEKPVELYVFPNEHHIKVQPEHRLAVFERSIDWFDFWLQDRIDADPAKAAQYDRWRTMRERAARQATPSAP